MKKKFITALTLFWTIIFIFLNEGLLAQRIGQNWPSWSSYESMSCSELNIELSHMRKDLTALQMPEYFEEKTLWNQAQSRFNIIIKIYEERCRLLNLEQKQIPEPRDMDLLPEKELVEYAMKAIRNGMYKAGEKLLRQGAIANYPNAQYNLGMWNLATGKKEEGKKWLEKASKLGSAEAQSTLEKLSN